MDYDITAGFTRAERGDIVALYWQAFGHKLGRVLGPEPRALRFLDRVLDPTFALVARDAGGQVLGVAGFKTADGALVGGDYRDLQHIYGSWGALWRGLILSVIDRDLAAGVLLMDGICVQQTARGRGIGTALLDAVKATAQDLGKSTVRLDVIDINPRAKALYERQGFTAHKTEHTGPFRYIFRFDAATQMLWDGAGK